MQDALRESDSVGLAAYPYDGISEKELLKKADKNMYQNKVRNKSQSLHTEEAL